MSPAITGKDHLPAEFIQDKDSTAHLHFLKVVNLVGSCLNNLESLVAAEVLRQTLESIVADSQLS